MIEFDPDPTPPPATPLEARVLRRAELSDELGRLEKERTRLRRSRILGLGFLGVFTVALAWDVGSLLYTGISTIAWIGIAALYHRTSVRLASRVRQVQGQLKASSGSAS